MDKDIINWGIMGCGSIARNLQMHESCSGANLIAAASKREIKGICREFDLPYYYDNYDDFVKMRRWMWCILLRLIISTMKMLCCA